MVITRVIKAWDEHQSYHLGITVDTERDLHVEIPKGKELAALKKCIAIVDQILEEHVAQTKPGLHRQKPNSPANIQTEDDNDPDPSSVPEKKVAT